MGTTVTTNLSLIKPDTDESIKQNLPTFAGWASQNGINQDIIDSCFRASNTTYTPTWTASTTNPVLGTSGTITGKYIRLWPRMVFVEIRIFTGTASFTPGSGTYSLSLPVAPDTQFSTSFDSIAVGKGILLDNDAVVSSTNLVPLLTPAGNLYCRVAGTGGTTWTNTVPITLAINDRVSLYAMYPTAAP